MARAADSQMMYGSRDEHIEVDSRRESGQVPNLSQGVLSVAS
jgi:hypothetical protein